MGGNVLKKLRSSKGASITFALLAFLVCAVISAILLASASAASGRASDLAKMDQRYYAVTSAAQLFCDTLDGQEIVVKRYYENTQKAVQKWVYSEESESVLPDGAPVPIEQNEEYKLYMQIPDDTISLETERTTDPKSTSFLSEAALFYVFGDKIEDNDVKYWLRQSFDATGRHFKDPVKQAKHWVYQIDAGTGYPSLTVIADVSMAADGSMVITFSNAADASNKDVFSVEVKLAASADTQTISTGPNRSSKITDFGEDYYKEEQTDVRTETKTTTIKWTVSDIKKVTA